ncbi:MAG: hypothetical protein ACR2P7_02260 [bacterium]
MDFVAEYSALAVALCALGFTAWQISVQRKHNRISVKPFLHTHIDHIVNDAGVNLRVSLINGGLGPAFINEFKVLRNGKECNFEEEVRSVMKTRAGKVFHTVLDGDAAMSRNEKHVLLSVTLTEMNEEEVGNFEEEMGEFDLVVRYSSIYEDKFTYDSIKERLKKQTSWSQ